MVNQEIKKAIIPVAGLGVRFLPLSMVLPKELWPLVDIPVLQYVIQEAKDSGIEEIIFVISPEKKIILDYFKESQKSSKNKVSNLTKIERVLTERNKYDILENINKFRESLSNISFSAVLQKNPLGDGDAILQAAKFIKNEPCAVLFGDDIIDAKISGIDQLSKVFTTCQKPVIGLYQLPKEKLSSYGVVKIEKIANRLHKIKKIVEKPEINEAPSDLAIVGRYILTPDVFSHLKKVSPDKGGEIRLSAAFDKMIDAGNIIYGYELDGKWLECGNKLGLLKSNVYFALKHPEYGGNIKQFIKEIL